MQTFAPYPLQLVPELVNIIMTIYDDANKLELVWLADDCQWVVLTPSGYILGPRFFNAKQAGEFLDGVQDVWHKRDTDTDVDSDI